MKHWLSLAAVAALACAQAQTPIAWSELDLARPELKSVAEAVARGDDTAAGEALLAHWRARKDAREAWAKAKGRKPSDFDRRLADDALEHRFFAHKGYQPSYFYGKDIDWTYWPVKANELRWQLHRHKWFIPLLKVYADTGDARYFTAWRDQWADWRKKNPFPSKTAADRENERFAWRALEISDRLNGLPQQLALAVHAPEFTPADLRVALGDVVRHGELVRKRRAAEGNHLLFEMRRLLGVSTAFPELKATARWRANAIRTLKEEIFKQVYPDGVQFELDLGYHTGAYALFRDSINLAPEAFTAEERLHVARMAAFGDDLFFPDGEHPYFADTHALGPKRRNMFDSAKKEFPKLFERPVFASRAYPNGGFYVLREGSPEDGAMVVLKAGPPAEWHNQPDNGTFSYWRKGRDFFPDAGSYVYGGADTEADRAAFRATRAHSTLTLNGENIAIDKHRIAFDESDKAFASRLLKWETKKGTTTVAVETPSYPGLTHRRTMTLAPGGTLTVDDVAEGAATGLVEVRFCLAPGANPVRQPDGSWRTRFPDGNGIRLSFKGEGWEADVEPGWRSRFHAKKEPRPILRLRRTKTSAASLRLRTRITPLAQPNA